MKEYSYPKIYVISYEQSVDIDGNIVKKYIMSDGTEIILESNRTTKVVYENELEIHYISDTDSPSTVSIRKYDLDGNLVDSYTITNQNSTDSNDFNY